MTRGESRYKFRLLGMRRCCPPLVSGVACNKVFRGCAVREVVIQDSVINSPFGEPQRHFRFDDEGIANEIAHDWSAPLNPIVEVSGEAKKDKAAKVATARTFWVPAVNNHGGFGRWGFIEISDPWDAENTIRAFIQSTAQSDQRAA